MAEPRAGGRASFSLGELGRRFASRHRRGVGGSDGTAPLLDGGLGDGENCLTPGCPALGFAGRGPLLPVLFSICGFPSTGMGWRSGFSPRFRPAWPFGGWGVSHTAPLCGELPTAPPCPRPWAWAPGGGGSGKRGGGRPCRFLRPWHQSRAQPWAALPERPRLTVLTCLGGTPL